MQRHGCRDTDAEGHWPSSADGGCLDAAELRRAVVWTKIAQDTEMAQHKVQLLLPSSADPQRTLKSAFGIYKAAHCVGEGGKSLGLLHVAVTAILTLD